MVKTGTCILGFLLLMGCRKNNPEITRTIALEPFKEIHLNSPFDVVLQEDTAFFIEIEGYEKTVDAIDFTVMDSILRLENNLGGRFLKPKTNKVKLIIHSKPLRLIQANETCFIETANPITSHDFGLIMKSKSNNAELELNTKGFYFWNNYPCGGRLTLTGKTEQLQLWCAALFSVDAKNLETKYAFVENNSKGNCSVNAVEAMEYNIRGEGNIEVYGNPPIVVKNGHSGAGEFLLY